MLTQLLTSFSCSSHKLPFPTLPGVGINAKTKSSLIKWNNWVLTISFRFSMNWFLPSLVFWFNPWIYKTWLAFEQINFPKSVANADKLVSNSDSQAKSILVFILAFPSLCLVSFISIWDVTQISKSHSPLVFSFSPTSLITWKWVCAPSKWVLSFSPILLTK